MTLTLEKAVHVAQHIIKAHPKFMSPVKLQCLLYFAQKESLVQRGAPMFAEKILAYPDTPYVQEVAVAFSGLRLDRAARAWRWDALHQHAARYDRLRSLRAWSARHWGALSTQRAPA